MNTTRLMTALGCAVVAGVSAHAAVRAPMPADSLVTSTAANDGAGLPGLPGGKGGASGRAAAGTAGAPGRSGGYDPEQVFGYCISLLETLRRGGFDARRGPNGMGPGECANLFATMALPGGGGGGGGGGAEGGGGGGGGTPAESGQPGRGGNGGGLPGLPGGKGGKAGSPGSAKVAPDQSLVRYCMDLLRQTKREAMGLPPSATRPESDVYEPSDCADYYASMGPSQQGETAGTPGKRDGRDGASISGGVGGKGGKAGAGPGGGSGGHGGLGSSGGAGGRGGAGGASD